MADTPWQRARTMGGPDDPIAQLAPVEQEAQAWVMRFASGEATSADLQALKRWCGQTPSHAEAFAKANRLWEALGPAGQRVDWKSPARHSQTLSFTPQRMGRRAFLGGALASSAAAAAYALVHPPLGLWPSFSQLTADYRTATGERKNITLADGVSIEMNAQTSIAVRKTVSDTRHIELLAGEAAVATGPDASQSFALIAGQGRTMARRAHFDVRYIGTTVCVTCLEGEIRVEQEGAATPLQAQQQILYSTRGQSSIRTVDPAVVAAWRDGFLVFHATPLAEAVEEINRYRPGKIVLTNDTLGRRLFNARFRIENVGEVVDQIRQVFGAKATSLPGGIVLLS